MTFMGRRLAHISLLLLGLVFAFASVDAFAEPWRFMNEAVVAETICGHLVGLFLSIFCFRAAVHLNEKAAYRASQIREPNL